MRFLIIDDDAEYRDLLRYHLEVEWPDAGVDDYQPSSAGTSPSSLELAAYDAVLLAHPIRGEVGFEGLSRLLRNGDCPPVLVFAHPSDEFMAVDALKAGAASFFPKSRITHQRLITTLRAELSTGLSDRSSLSLAGGIGLPPSYRLVDTLHSSDIVSVYLAEAKDGGRRLAFKVIRYVPDSGGGRLFDRFLQEYEVIAQVEHPSVVKIFDFGVADDHAYIAMEYLAGGSLADRLKQALEVDTALDYLRQIGGALTAIHAAGILHRDLKPGNIMFRDAETLVLIDFGLAKSMKLAAAITGAGQIFGTPYYMSPEQGHAEPADARSDVYSLGCVFYEMLTGRRPFMAGSAMGVIYKHAHAPRPRLNAELQPLQACLDRMLARDPRERYQSVAEVLDELDALNAHKLSTATSSA